MLEFSVMVAIVPLDEDEDTAVEAQSNSIREDVTPSHTCISLYGCVRAWSICSHAPIEERNDSEEGVRELARFEN